MRQEIHSNISVIICTRNLCESLAATLAAMRAVTVPAGWAVELLVVDNGSTDATQRLVDAAKLGGPKI